MEHWEPTGPERPSDFAVARRRHLGDRDQPRFLSGALVFARGAPIAGAERTPAFRVDARAHAARHYPSPLASDACAAAARRWLSRFRDCESVRAVRRSLFRSHLRFSPIAPKLRQKLPRHPRASRLAAKFRKN